MKKNCLGLLWIVLFSSVELHAGKKMKEETKTEKKLEKFSSEVPIIEEKQEHLERKLSTSTAYSDETHDMDVESPETLSPEALKKTQNMTMLLEAALKNIGNDFSQQDLEHVRHTFNALSPQQQHKFLQHFSFEKVKLHLLNNLNSIYHHLKAK